MTLFIGRQPILDRSQKTYGYELLFRDGPENAFSGHDADQATMKVIDTSVGQMGIQRITGGRKAFINFTRHLLLGDYGSLLPRGQVVIEILETITPDADITASCRRLKDGGYTLALDDFHYAPAYEPLLEIVDIIKVDLSTSGDRERLYFAETYLPRNIKLIAERVETLAEFEQTKEMGYSYFQGYFFSKPVVLTAEKPPESKLTRIQLLMEINRPEFDFSHAEEIIKHDPTLSVKLFRYINSAIFGIRQEVKSIRQALTLLGEKNIRKWCTILVISSLADDKPPELFKQAIVRARFCELLAGSAGQAGADQELFMTGMFSLLDTILNQAMPDLLADLPLSTAVKETLLGEPTRFQDIFNLVTAFEIGNWDQIETLSNSLHIRSEILPAFQQQAFAWADQISAG
jgi:EAL and modified HD-GYP domain-containing signal transduction protein